MNKKYVFASSLLLMSTVSISETNPTGPIVPVVPEVPIVLEARLGIPQETSQTVAGTPGEAEGSASFLYYPSTRQLHYSITYAGLSGQATMAHFHLGPSTTNGPIIQWICETSIQPKPSSGANSGGVAPISGTCSTDNFGQLSGVWNIPYSDLFPTYEEAILQGGIYVNIHTVLNPPGEIRGQIMP